MLRGMVFIPGFEKCGTTTLHHWLGQHSAICASSPKEPQHFEREYWLGEDHYLNKYFAARRINQHSVMLDSRPRNAIVAYVVDRIKESCVAPKFIFTMRDPAERAASAYRHWRQMRPGREPLDFQSAIHDNYFDLQRGALFDNEAEYLTNLDPAGGTYRRLYIENGLYCSHIKRFEAAFGYESILTITLDDITWRPDDVLKGIARFIGVDEGEFNDIDRAAKNRSPIGGVYTEGELTYLKDFYRSAIDWEYLHQLTGIDLKSRWNY